MNVLFSFRNEISTAAKQASAESNNNSLNREPRPAGERKHVQSCLPP